MTITDRLKKDLENEGIEVIKIRYWRGDPTPYVEIHSRHRENLGILQETIGDRYKVLFTIKL